MSDDDINGYSPYDEFEEMLYDADPAPDLADDLAEHTMHSPVFGDEPVTDLVEYQSDWEYYSDDYWDDDPDLLKNNPQDGSPIRRLKVGQKTKQDKDTRKGRKRKLTEYEGDIPVLDLGERKKLKDCIKGTVWAQPIDHTEVLYQEGNNEKVALLKDWRKKFATQLNNKRDHDASWPALERDESWAADMSLADMGLVTSRGNERGGEGEGDVDTIEEEQEEEYEDDDENEDGDDDNDNDMGHTEDQDVNKPLETILESKGQHEDNSQELTSKALSNESPSPNSQHGLGNDDTRERKQTHRRRKKANMPTPPSSTSTAEIKTATTVLGKAQPIVRGRKRKAVEEESDEVSNHAGPEKSANEEEADGIGTINRAMTSGRASKRVASSKAVSATDDANQNVQAALKAQAAPTASPARATRSRKKA